MGRSRLAAIPFEHMEAEMLAFPIASEAAFEKALVSVHPQLRKESGFLWREAESKLLSGFPSVSLDEFINLRDRVWFYGTQNQEVALWKYVQNLSEKRLDSSGGGAVPRLPKSEVDHPTAISQEAQARSSWRWLSFALPPDLLLAAYPDGPLPTSRVNTLSPEWARQMNESGFAEVHLHLGAALEFHDYWVGLMRMVANSQTDPNSFASPGAAFAEGRDLGAWLLRAALVRFWLVAFLAYRTSNPRQNPKPIDLESFIQTCVWPQLRFWRFDVVLAKGVLQELASGKLSHTKVADYQYLRLLYANVSNTWAFPVPKTVDEIQQVDPIAAYYPPGQRSDPTPEMRFIADALRYMEESQDRYFAVLFWQVQRIRNIFYRHVIQRPLTPGLQWFIRHFSRIKAGRPWAFEVQLGCALEIDGYPGGLRSLEFRTSPSADISETRELVKRTQKVWEELLDDPPAKGNSAGSRSLPPAYSSRMPNNPDRRRSIQDRPELGIVLHFSKDRGGGSREGSPAAFGFGSNADPGWRKDLRPNTRNPSGYRFSQFFHSKMQEAQTFARLMLGDPGTLRWLRGVDMCTDEFGVPNWVMVPLFSYVRKASEEASRVLKQYQGVDIPPIRSTAHVGEDYVHLRGGLRRIDEAIEHFGFSEGDRIGHGLALGEEPFEWAKRMGKVSLSKEELLFDLAWEWHCYESGQVNPAGPGRLAVLEGKLAKYSRDIFNKALRPDQVTRFVQILFNEDRLKDVGFPNGLRGRKTPADPQSEELDLLFSYLTKADVFERGRELEWVDTADEGETLAALQNGLRQKIGSMGIAVEVNPSSNLLIGDLSDLDKHPLWRLYPPLDKAQGVPPVEVVIGSDDSLTFATNLPDEYQLLFDTMVLSGLSQAQANRWLNRVRMTALHARFTLSDLGDLPTFQVMKTRYTRIKRMP